MPYLTLYAAGSNSHGQLGIGHEDDAHTFTKCNDLAIEVRDIDTLQVKLCAGANHTLLLVRHGDHRQNELFIAGTSRRGQLGKAEEQNKLSFAVLSIDALLQNVTPYSNVLDGRKWIFKDVAAAWETSFFLLENSEDPAETILIASGSNDFGQLAVQSGGSTNAHSSIVIAIAGKRISSIHSGPRHTVVICEDGEIYGWGASRHGQLGSEATAAITYTPTLLKEARVAPCSREIVALGHQHTALVSKGDVKGAPILLGNNKKGQLGIPDPKARMSSQQRFAQDDGISVFANWNASFILDKDANVIHSMGNNASGQLGRDSQAFGDIGTVELATEAEKGKGRRRIVQVACGSEHTLAILEDQIDGQREVWGWGWNEHGNLGLGQDVLDDVKRPIKLHLPAGSTGRVHSVHAGNGTSWIALIESSV
ncbi:RCC1/BLIP-II [Cystobasidium minutum MCA 4210]|uniref:RCC1/BLIP-II n=1 Tax=Cystobasidium minutum MCA 4210 TaxID=1397322 RepID=UPI0034D01B7A|eukprot:jgi/Rhomi1/172665/fgenesh1_kg.5_\